MPSSRIAIVDGLRGLAAMAVCWFHFTQGNHAYLSDGWLKTSGHYGWMGVEVFFVISGFVIPYSLYRSGYRMPQDFGRFFVKRIVRIEPSYLANICLVLILLWISRLVPGFQGPHTAISPWFVAMHFGYLNAFFDQPWLNVVYWTLAIEFQYYLLVALIFPLISLGGLRGTVVTCTAALAGQLVPSTNLVFHWFPLFSLGILAFQLRCARIPSAQYILGTAITASIAAYFLSPLIAAIASASGLLIAFYQGPVPRWLISLGAISYSLYLVHVPVGGRVINLGARLPDHLLINIAVLLLAVGFSLLSAWIMYFVVESPSQRWSSRFTYRSSAKQLQRTTEYTKESDEPHLVTSV